MSQNFKLTSRFPQAQALIKAGVRRGVQSAALDLLGKAQNLAPVDTGDLRGSGNTEFQDTAGGYTGTVGFAAEYATVQHEDLTFEHPQGGQAKYLEEPYLENLERYKDALRNTIGEGL